jgi:ABC-type phosphate/phosphonate transport system substrate-binding protein
MYDWPEVQAATDLLWQHISRTFQARQIPTPQKLTRNLECPQIWRHRDLIFGQTCGLPYAQSLRDHVKIVGTADYACDQDPPGHYHSVIVTRRGSDVLSPLLNEVAPDIGPVAVNARHSQSGYVALLETFPPRPNGRSPFRDILITRGHRQSIHAVAEGRANLAAIDCVSWHLAKKFEPAAIKLEVIARSEARPALPFITAPQHDADGIADAVEESFAALPQSLASELGLRGFQRFTDRDYSDFTERFDKAVSAHGMMA